MAHFAELDENNEVTRVIVIHNNVLLDENDIESEELGKEFCTQTYGGRWVQTSYNSNFRVRYAGIGYRYDEELDAFIEPCIYPSWTLVGADWVPPIPYPSENPEGWTYNAPAYWWDEDAQQWQLMPDPAQSAESAEGSGE